MGGVGDFEGVRIRGYVYLFRVEAVYDSGFGAQV